MENYLSVRNARNRQVKAVILTLIVNFAILGGVLYFSTTDSKASVSDTEQQSVATKAERAASVAERP